MKNFFTANNKYKKSYQKYLKFETKNMQPNIKILWKKASGFEIQDKFNKKYIDFTSGIFASNIGYKNKILEKHVKTAIDSGICHTYNYYNFYRERYSQELINFVGSKKLKKCFLVSLHRLLQILPYKLYLVIYLICFITFVPIIPQYKTSTPSLTFSFNSSGISISNVS